MSLQDQSIMERLIIIAEDENQDGTLRQSCVEAVGELGLQDKTVKRLLSIAEDIKQDGKLRLSCVEAVGKLGSKDKAIELLLKFAKDEKQEEMLRISCAKTLGWLGSNGKQKYKDKAVDILISLYFSLPDKTSEEARQLYDSLWVLTEF
jgi:HEAT repeat protein